ncbi:MOB kinase activator 2 isoform X2 [Brienomyrus brachyistius]|uniref:MOB kinase activator 2 isoform X2 n=1 Tax=Brienomyrus brachyistius TaxID=42636 RepID=UPI0020B18AFA|nr:MOB kinase activator 2 isoform X2 [Brienomyrus brachyistius]
MGGCESYFAGAETSGDSPDVAAGKPKKNKKATPSLGQKPYLLDAYTAESLCPVNMRALCTLPDGVDKAEWIASHTVAFFHLINVLSSTLSEFCTTQTCPTARGPGNRTFYWTDEYGKKVSCSGPLYTSYIMCYIRELLADQEVFPTKPGSSFPMGYTFLAQRIFLYLSHTLAHLYWAHFQHLVALEMHTHLNTVFTHFTLFGREFQLLDWADTEPLEDLFLALTRHQDM